MEDEDDFQISVTAGTTGDTVDLLLTLTTTSFPTDLAQSLVATWLVFPMLTLMVMLFQRFDTAFVIGILSVVNDRIELKRIGGCLILPRPLSGKLPASDYAYYRWVAQSGTPTMQGYLGGRLPTSRCHQCQPKQHRNGADWRRRYGAGR